MGGSDMVEVVEITMNVMVVLVIAWESMKGHFCQRVS